MQIGICLVIFFFSPIEWNIYNNILTLSLQISIVFVPYILKLILLPEYP